MYPSLLGTLEPIDPLFCINYASLYVNQAPL
jgi:hypothetical protein